MKNTMCFVSLLLCIMLCLPAFAACGVSDDADAPASNNTNAPDPSDDTADEALFVAPADSLGCVVSADSSLITWNAYSTDEETIDFMGVDVEALGVPGEMSLFYLESDVTYYLICDGKLVKASASDVVPGAIVGITTLDEGVQELYIISTPVEDDGSDEPEEVEEESDDTTSTDSTETTAAQSNS